MADAHYDLGFLSMVAHEEERLRAHEERALALYTAAGHEEGVIRARQALVLALFLAGDYEAARELESASGLVRALGMASIILLTNGDAELGARVAGATYRLVSEKGVMLAPVQVLHLPDPAGLATERFGDERAARLM